MLEKDFNSVTFLLHFAFTITLETYFVFNLLDLQSRVQ
jgi:hypothetical protein